MIREIISKRIDQGRGTEKADLVLKNGRFFDLVTGELVESDIAICGDMIVGTCEDYEGVEEVDLDGKIVVPGFIDTHLHIESSMVTPFEFDRCVLPYGVTTALCDPHEIANVLGIEGIEYFLKCAERTIMDVRVQLSSCVPATQMETSGARLEAKDLTPLMDHPKVIGLAEFMNYPGVLNKDEECLDKLEAFAGRHIDGHAPLVRGHDINGYLAAGISTDHETTTADEAMEKLRKGMHILVREGSVSKDLHALAPIITERNSPFIALCTDDRNPLDIAEQGHLDYMIRTAIKLGADPLAMYRAASISAARAYGLKDRGLVAPGWRADLVIISDLYECDISDVYSAGRKVDNALFATRETIPPIGRDSVRSRDITARDLHIKSGGNEAHVIGIVPGKIITQHIRSEVLDGRPEANADLGRDIIKISIIERHGKNGNVGTGFVNGFGLQSGAIASTVCHDHHNIAVVGVDDGDMALAANRLREIEGGFVVVDGGEVLAEVALPIAGLMSLEPFEHVRDQLITLRAAAKGLGVTLEEPFLQLAFLALPVIPHLKITDMGMVDVDRFQIIPS
ncbi:adenine deaminase [Lentilitoribacter sp. Alg239-R112]|uniref:adenine deaminase n=1 Tax=Lentilitoribacter sp. Alg239-R112 TaxID=2305987 RepID=UPI0013A70614|nr:adenine deaminase [Lentilitoribacter sp. Alg239-R112]